MYIMGQVEETTFQLNSRTTFFLGRKGSMFVVAVDVAVHLVTNQESCGTFECMLLGVYSVIEHTTQGKPLHAFLPKWHTLDKTTKKTS